MTPLFGCVLPVCFLFLALGIAGVLMYFAGAGASRSQEADAPPSPRPPYWVVPVVLLVATVVLLLLSLVTEG